MQHQLGKRLRPRLLAFIVFAPAPDTPLSNKRGEIRGQICERLNGSSRPANSYPNYDASSKSILLCVFSFPLSSFFSLHHSWKVMMDYGQKRNENWIGLVASRLSFSFFRFLFVFPNALYEVASICFMFCKKHKQKRFIIGCNAFESAEHNASLFFYSIKAFWTSENAFLSFSSLPCLLPYFINSAGI